MAELKKGLGFLQLLALGVAGLIGSSWIYTNSKFFDKYGAGGMIFGMLLGGLLASCVALAYSELTTLFPRAGGEVVYSYVGLGRRASFTTGWLLIGAYLSSTAFYVTAFGYLLEKIWPNLGSVSLYSVNRESVDMTVLIIGVVLTLIIAAMNWFGVSLSGQIQTVLFVAMVVIGLALVVTALVTGSPSNFIPPYRADANALGDTLRFVVPGMTYMAGFGLVAALAEDADIPARKIGRITVLTVLTATLFYCLVLASSAWILPWQDVAKMHLGTIDAYTTAGFPILGWGAWIIAICGLLTSFLGLFMAISRIVVAMARARLLPEGLAAVDEKSGAPRRAILLTTVMTLLLGALGPGAMLWFLDTGGIYLGLVWIIVVITLSALPKKYPHLRSKYHAGWLPWAGAVGALVTVVMAIWPGTNTSLVWPGEYLVLLVWAVIGFILWRLAKPMGEDEALGSLLGSYADDLKENLGEVEQTPARS